MKNQKGFIALTSAIIISFLLITITVNLGFSGFLGSLNLVDKEAKKQSLALAQTCVDMAMLKIVKNKDYILKPPERIFVGSKMCDIISILPIAPRNFPITIKTQAVVNKAHTNLEVTINENFEVISEKELPNI